MQDRATVSAIGFGEALLVLVMIGEEVEELRDRIGGALRAMADEGDGLFEECDGLQLAVDGKECVREVGRDAGALEAWVAFTEGADAEGFFVLGDRFGVSIVVVEEVSEIEQSHAQGIVMIEITVIAEAEGFAEDLLGFGQLVVTRVALGDVLQGIDNRRALAAEFADLDAPLKDDQFGGGLTMLRVEVREFIARAIDFGAVGSEVFFGIG